MFFQFSLRSCAVSPVYTWFPCATASCETVILLNQRTNNVDNVWQSKACDTDGNLVRDCEKSVRNHGNQSEITEIWLEIRNQGLETQ